MLLDREFYSVAGAKARAKRRLPRPVYDALIAGSERGITAQDNVGAFDELGFLPVVAGQRKDLSLNAQVAGFDLSVPLLMSPTGVQAIHPAGELAVARAARRAGVAIGVSSFASHSIEEVCSVNPDAFFQAYWIGSRDEMMWRLARARDAGVRVLALTLDWSFGHRRDDFRSAMPVKMDLWTMAKFVPVAIAKPTWLYQFARQGKLPRFIVPNLPRPDGSPRTFFEAKRAWQDTPAPDWGDVAWLREQWEGPFMIKGICRSDDARRAVDVGADVISVSNHGGNNVDGTPAAIRLLPSVVEAVGSEVEVVLDGGVRRGSDVVKAVALGARAVMIGRAYLWGLAAGGERGVDRVLELLREGIESTLYGLGVSSIEDLSPENILVKPGFRF